MSFSPTGSDVIRLRVRFNSASFVHFKMVGGSCAIMLFSADNDCRFTNDPISCTACVRACVCDLKYFKKKKHVVRGVWCVVCGVVCGVWCVVCGVWCVVCGVWCVVCGVWCVVCSMRTGNGMQSCILCQSFVALIDVHVFRNFGGIG